MVEVIYNGRLGNQMFEYALGRILAEELGFQLVARPLPFLSTQIPITGKSYTDDVYCYSGHKCDFEHLLNEKPQKKILLNGYFQRSSYYLPYWDRIKKWYSYPKEEELTRKYRSLEEISSEDILLYIRLSDYVTVYNWALTAQFFHTVLEMATYRNVYIITEDDEDPFLKEFEKYDPTCLMSDPLTQMFLGSFFNKIAMSCSTFSWWGAMLSNANEIYFPVGEDGIWCDCYKDGSIQDVPLYRKDLDLRIDDSRITYFYHCPTVATRRQSSGLVTLSEVLPTAAAFHKNSKAFSFIT